MCALVHFVVSLSGSCYAAFSEMWYVIVLFCACSLRQYLVVVFSLCICVKVSVGVPSDTTQLQCNGVLRSVSLPRCHCAV